MKNSSTRVSVLIASGIALILSAPCGSGAAEPEEKETPKIRDIITHQQLVALRQNAEAADPLSTFEKAEGEDPAKKSAPKDIISQSDFLSCLGIATLVPKRAIIHVPKHLKNRIQFRDGTKIVTWPNFFAKNRAWITTMEVSRLQAEGNVPLDEKKFESVVNSGDVIVATMGGCPISVLPLKVPESEDGGTGDENEEEVAAIKTNK